MAYSEDKIDLPIWAKVVCGLVAGGVVVHIVRGWWDGSMRLVRFFAKHQAYVGSKGTTIVLTGPLELTVATLLLGGIALLFGLLAVRPMLLRKPWVIVPVVCMIVGGAALLHYLIG